MIRIEDVYERVETVKASTVEPLTLEEVKDHLRIERGETAEDDLLSALISATRQFTEDYTGRALIRRHLAVYFDDWSTEDCVRLPFPPLVAITSSTAVTDSSSGAAVAYKDSTRGWNSFSSTGWVADTVSEPGRLCLEYDENWPTDVLHNVNPIKIHFTCGYSTSSTGVPQPIRSAMKMAINHLYENREQYVVGYGGVGAIEVPGTVKTLLNDYRIYGF